MTKAFLGIFQNIYFSLNLSKFKGGQKHISPLVLVNFAEIKHTESEIFSKIQVYLGQNWVFFSHLGSIFHPKISFAIHTFFAPKEHKFYD